MSRTTKYCVLVGTMTLIGAWLLVMVTLFTGCGPQESDPSLGLGGGVSAATDIDTDGDLLTDAEEAILGTDPKNANTHGENEPMDCCNAKTYSGGGDSAWLLAALAAFAKGSGVAVTGNDDEGNELIVAALRFDGKDLEFVDTSNAGTTCGSGRQLQFYTEWLDADGKEHSLKYGADLLEPAGDVGNITEETPIAWEINEQDIICLDGVVADAKLFIESAAAGHNQTIIPQIPVIGTPAPLVECLGHQLFAKFTTKLGNLSWTRDNLSPNICAQTELPPPFGYRGEWCRVPPGKPNPCDYSELNGTGGTPIEP